MIRTRIAMYRGHFQCFELDQTLYVDADVRQFDSIGWEL
jgi:hypothetical protein